MTAALQGWNLGFIGLGLMGKPMCLNLHRAGASLRVYNRTRGVAEALQQDRLKVCQSPAEVAAGSDIIIVMVADTPAVEAVLLGENGVLSGLRAGTLVIDMGTTAVGPTRRFAEQLRAREADFLDHRAPYYRQAYQRIRSALSEFSEPAFRFEDLSGLFDETWRDAAAEVLPSWLAQADDR